MATTRRAILQAGLAIPFGWLSKPEQTQPLQAEIEQVHQELVLFRDEYLPILVDHWPPVYRSSIYTHRRGTWREVITRLDLALVHHKTMSREPFRRFMFQRTMPALSWYGNTLRWKIGLFCTMEAALAHCQPRCRSEQEFSIRLPEIKQWMLGLPAAEAMEPLCTVLPWIADVDPAFAAALLSVDRWRCQIRPGPWERFDRGFIERYFAHGILNESILHAIGALANNHFPLIREYFGHPCLYGRCLDLMPHYVFAVLFEKVRFLSP